MNKKQTITLTAILGIAGLLMAGCSSLDKGLYDESLVQHPAITNVIVIPAFTNNTTGEVTPERTQETVKPAHTEKVLSNKPSIEATIEMAKEAPIPYAAIGGSLLAALYSGYRLIRNKQALKAVVLGVEAGRGILQSTPEGQKIDSLIKDELIKHQEAAGVLKLVSDVVSDYTGDTVRPK